MSATSSTGPVIRLQVLHQLIERIGQRIAHFPRQMGVELRGTRTAVSKILLNDPQVDTGFQQMSGVGMPPIPHAE